jgi:hypothetical protein
MADTQIVSDALPGNGASGVYIESLFRALPEDDFGAGYEELESNTEVSDINRWANSVGRPDVNTGQI